MAFKIALTRPLPRCRTPRGVPHPIVIRPFGICPRAPLGPVPVQRPFRTCPRPTPLVHPVRTCPCLRASDLSLRPLTATSGKRQGSEAPNVNGSVPRILRGAASAALFLLASCSGQEITGPGHNSHTPAASTLNSPTALPSGNPGAAAGPIGGSPATGGEMGALPSLR
jgi:hypothetical protein